MPRPSGDQIVHGLDTYTDLATGKRYAYGTDEEVTDHLDATGRQVLLDQLAPRQAGVVGNLADLQRGGAAVLKEQGSMSDGVEAPPDRTAEQVADDAVKAEKAEAVIAEAGDKLADVAAGTDTKKGPASVSKSDK